MLTCHTKLSHYIIITFLAIAALGVTPAYAGDLFQNTIHGYELDINPDWSIDLSAYPDTVVWEIGDGGRLIAGIIQLPGEEAAPTCRDFADAALSGMQSNFDEFTILDESWTTPQTGLESYDISFECFINDETAGGAATLACGDVTVMILYYDDPLDFDYYRADIHAAFETLRISKDLIETAPPAGTVTDEKPLDYIDPLRIVYRNDTFSYCISNPFNLKPAADSPDWVTFPAGEGEISIRYIDAYFGTGKSPEEYVGELIPEILVSFSRFETTEEHHALLDDERPAYAVDLDAVLNGIDWRGTFVGFYSDDDEPFLVSFSAPADEYDEFKNAFDEMWRSIRFDAGL